MASKLIERIEMDGDYLIEVSTDEVIISNGYDGDSMSDLSKAAKLYNALAKYLQANGVEFDW